MRNWLILSRGDVVGSPEGHQVLALELYRRELERGLGLTFRRVDAWTPEEIEQRLETSQEPVAVVMASWSDPVERLIEVFERAREQRPERKLVFLDYYAPTSTPHFGVLPSVDLYLKRQTLADLSAYQSDYAGGFLFTDYLVREQGYDLEGWHFGSRPDPAEVHKIVPIWSLGVIGRYRTLNRWSRRVGPAWWLRPFAINRRVGLINLQKKLEWYQRYRESLLERLVPMEGRWRMTGRARVGSKRYLAELLLSRVVVSPFGWGEVCFRDYEAVAAGCLLVKPSMDHVRTEPDIYRAGQTYVSVRWDLGDLEEQLEHYLSRPREALAIVRRAQRVLSDYDARGGVMDRVRLICERLERG